MKSKIRNKDIIETQVLHQFIGLYSYFPKGKISKSESPDFIVQLSPRKKIGIELVEIHFPQNPVEALLNTIVSKEEKLPYYMKKNLSEYWLLIWSENIFANKSINLKNVFLNMNFASAYHAIFLLDITSSKMITLK